MIRFNGTKTSLKSLIETEALNEEYKYDDDKHQIYGRGELFLATRDEYDRLMKHQEICKELYRLSHENNNFPYSSLVPIAINYSAHKQSEFYKGYKNINIEKTEKILKWLKRLAKHCGDDRYSRYDIVVHAVMKFYDKVSTSTKVFNKVVKEFDSKGRKPSAWKNMEAFYSEFMQPMFDNIEIEIQ